MDTPVAPIFFLELEDDPIKNNELGASDDPLESVPHLQAGDEHGSNSYLSLQCSSIQIVRPGRVLLVWHASFHPGLGRRFQIATLVCKFLSAPGATTEPLAIVGHAPRRAFGGSSKESRTVHWGVELPLSFPAGPASAQLSPSGSLEKAKDVEHTFTITGTARGSPKKTNCVWTVEENSSSRRGIPSEIQFVTLLECEGPFLCEVNVSGRTGGIIPRWLKTRTSLEGRQGHIDPQRYRGRLKEYDFEGDAGKCDQMLQKWTGEVEGAIVEFLQPVVKT